MFTASAAAQYSDIGGDAKPRHDTPDIDLY